MEFAPVYLTTTFRLLRQHDARSEGYDLLAAYLGGDEAYGMDTQIPLLSLLDSNPVEDVIWALRATEQDSSVAARLFAADCAESVLHIYESAYPDDRRPRDAVEAARAYARGEIDEAALTVAREAARDAAEAAARDAAWDAAWESAMEATRDAARTAKAAGYAWAAEKAKQIGFLKRYVTADNGE